MRISVRHNIKDFEKYLTKVEKKQLPFATSRALNKTKDRIQDDLKTIFLRKLHKPTPFTMNAFLNSAGTWAKKTKLTATIQIKDVQAEYMYTLFYGGSEVDKHIVPGKGYKLNQYGNLPRRASKSKNTFNIKSNGLSMTLKSKGKGKNRQNVVVGIWPRQRTYKQTISFEGEVQRSFDRWFEKMFDREWKKAIATAR